MKDNRRRPVLSVIGNAGALQPDVWKMCIEVGQKAVEAGFRIASGGLSGVMEAVCEGAHEASNYQDGDTIGIVPSYDRKTANRFVDIVIPSGMQLGRNVMVVALADVVMVVAGCAGTLSEIALAWQLGKPIIALEPSGGWAAKMAGQRVDERSERVIEGANSVDEAIALAVSRLEIRRPS